MRIKPCSKCHESKSLSEYYSRTRRGRLVYESSCKDCYKERALQYTRNNAQKNRERAKSWHRENKDRAVERNKVWALNNVEKMRSYRKKYEVAHVEEYRLWKAKYQRKRHASQRAVTPLWADKKEIDYIYSLAKERGLQVDHIVPINGRTVCGLHCEDNLRCISAELNTFKGNRYWPDSA